ncbi:transcriptional repressor [Litorilinea aerophila]|uniref:Transcriptional repressor n=1 Tax=Litorilinea aerophila TaxID=1204385 RepID=A0A540VKB2_9CHLR|nr:Fur family transcriptional regulator [Litorilinea aerophila]MCC9075235.1 transcriptional repressor [Litorilinea aerophila]GIV78376.1 MAG: peroxide-responsive transcriptional repressor PerR [Litorilinea sp.]
MTQANRFLNALKQAGYRITPQRRIICEYLAQTHSHPTPYQVYEELSREHPDISRATVYNTLNTLQELGVIVEIGFGAGHSHYETNPAPHINLICLRCHKIIDYEGPLPALGDEEWMARETGFQPVAAKVEVVGFCRECRERKKAEILAQWHSQRGTTDDSKQEGNHDDTVS